MKLCPICATSYSAEHRTCPVDGALLVETRELEPGTIVLGRYRIQRVLGSGGMGTVYLAQDALTNQTLALKFLPRNLTSDPALAQRFMQEARMANQLRHINIAQTLDLGQSEDGSFYIATEYVDGPSLRALLEQAPQGLPPDRVFEIVRGVAEGLGAAHAQGIVHRGIQPENILLAWDGNTETAKIADFNLSAMSGSVGRLTQTGHAVLTVEYAAPEQWLGKTSAEMDGRTDVYALGCMFYEMLTGRLPFSSTTYEGWFEQHMQVTPLPPSVVRPELRSYSDFDVAGLDALVLRMLAKDRESRPATVWEFLSELDAVTLVSRLAAAPVYGAPSLAGGAGSFAPGPHTPGGTGTVPISEFIAANTTNASTTSLPEWATAPPPPGEIPRDASPQAGKMSGLSRMQGMLIGFLGVLIVVAVIVVAAGKFLSGSNRVQGNTEPSNPGQDNSGQSSNTVAPGPAPGAVPKRVPTPAPMPKVTPQPASKPHPGAPAQPATPQPASVDAGGTGAGDLAKRAIALYENKQYEQAKPLFNEACDKGDVESCKYLGWMYQNKLGVELDYLKAAALYEKACNGNMLEGCNNLGFLYQHKLGVKQDYGKALQLYTKACDGGQASACNNLGVMYEDKQGVALDYARAAELYKKACDGGNANGCSDLGDLYATGHGVAKDMDKAKELLSKGCSMGNQWGCDRLKKLE